MRRLKEKYPIETEFGSEDPKERPLKAGSFTLLGTEKFEPASAEEISNYRDEIYPEWLVSCESFLRDLHCKLDAIEQPLIVAVSLANVGAEPANDVLVQFEVKGRNFGIFSPRDDDEEKDAEPPRLDPPPAAPRGRWIRVVPRSLAALDRFSRMATSSYIMRDMPLRLPVVPRPRDPDSFYWKDGHPSHPVPVAELTCQQWRHLEGEKCFEFRLGLKAEVGLIKDALAVTVHAANLAEPIHRIQKVSILTEEVDIWDDAETLLDIQQPFSGLSLPH